MKTLRYIGFILLAVILFFGLFIAYIIPCDSTLSILSWNIGYAGLGDNMDFFYDSGKKVRDTYERTIFNLKSITRFIKKNTFSTFYLIQEVDLHSKRSYYLNEKDIILAHSDYHSALAPNYVVKFVPIPPSSPMGHVNSGILSLSKYQPINSTRFSYPGKFGWPNRLFNLRRCMLVNRYSTSNGREFVLINTHMSAFDDGSLKKQEMQFLKDYVMAEYSKGNYVIVGGDWNQSPPNFPLTTFGENYKVDFFKLTNISPDFMPLDWKWVFDPKSPTNRYLNETHIPGKTFRSIIDLFLASPNVEVLQSQTYDMNFYNSDHNPIFMSFKLKP